MLLNSGKKLRNDNSLPAFTTFSILDTVFLSVRQHCGFFFLESSYLVKLVCFPLQTCLSKMWRRWPTGLPHRSRICGGLDNDKQAVSASCLCLLRVSHAQLHNGSWHESDEWLRTSHSLRGFGTSPLTAALILSWQFMWPADTAPLPASFIHPTSTAGHTSDTKLLVHIVEILMHPFNSSVSLRELTLDPPPPHPPRFVFRFLVEAWIRINAQNRI